ncbi:MAG: hypothetical protein COV35_06885 [Alphaproteobacteria bacterium CG11_big_fil_rev_8_21_14_0_20_39_49]|nr:MAG: hypothetical protein COV35_06885 [Alphaproteobacteria bacterium CG11_big_fil_rev_8_21_14_0_20_39_49]
MNIKLCLVNLFLIALIIVAEPVSAVEFPQKPEKNSFYVDEADIIQSSQAQELNNIAATLLNEEKIPIIVVTIPSLITYKASNMSIEQYARELFDEWGVGYKDRNFGILLLVSTGDRKARIEFGAGWNNQYNNEAEEIMQSLIIPEFKRGDYSLGILKGVKGLDSVARGLGLPKPTVADKVSDMGGMNILFMIIGGLLVVAIIHSIIKDGRSGWGWKVLIAIGAIIGIMFLLLAILGRNSGGDGGFGGGFGGGGGATGSW